MALIKTAEEIETLAVGGAKLAQIMQEVVARCVVGASAGELDAYAEKRIREEGGIPSFKGFGPKGEEFPNALCVSPNDMVVHGIPYEDLIFQKGDLIGLDLGMEYEGLFTDHAITVAIGTVSEDAQKLIEVTKKCLAVGVQAAQVGNTIGDIGHAVEEQAKGFGIVRNLVGHGVGHAVHEEPRVPNYGKKGSGDALQEGMVLAIEPMITLGGDAIATADDGWGVVSRDGSLTAHFEHTIAITKKGPRVLTQ